MNPFPKVRITTDEERDHASRASTQMLAAIAATGRHLYQGTVDPATKARRRAKNKAARRARRASR